MFIGAKHKDAKDVWPPLLAMPGAQRNPLSLLEGNLPSYIGGSMRIMSHHVL